MFITVETIWSPFIRTDSCNEFGSLSKTTCATLYLPKKKENLEKVYLKCYRFLKEAEKGLKSKNVEEVQWWLGDLFIHLCEFKEIVDPIIYQKIFDLKNAITESVSTILYFHTRFKNRKNLEEKMHELLKLLEERITEIRIYLRPPEED